MLTLAICDDNKVDLLKIAEIIKEWISRQADEEIEMKLFSSPYALLDAVSRGELFDMFLLDILMPEMTGISLGEKLQNMLTNPLLIFLTSSEDYYPDAFRLYAFQYLCKPIYKHDLFEVMDRAISQCEKRKRNVFTIKTGEGIVQIPLHTLVYAELSSHICHFHLSDGSRLQSQYLRTSFDSFIGALLQHRQFVKTHTAFVVNLNFAGKLTSNNLTLTTGAMIPVARAFTSNLQRHYMEYALREGNE